MSLTLAQKKETMQELIGEYYAPILREAGFVSYKNEGFHWYKVENDLLYKVHLPVSSPATPVRLAIGYAAIPLFTWEHIAPAGTYRDYFGDFSTCDHFVPAVNTLTNMLHKKYIGELPWNPVRTTKAAYYMPNGLFVQHEQTEKCGAETLEAFVLPLLDKLRTAEDVYRWNKMIRNLQNDCLIDESYVRKMSKRIERDELIPGMSLAFVDECLYCRDEKLYPVVRHFLKKNMTVKAEWEKQYPPKTKELVWESELSREHADVLLRAMETGDMSLIDAELAKQRERMFAQIRKKLPELKIN